MSEFGFHVSAIRSMPWRKPDGESEEMIDRLTRTHYVIVQLWLTG